VIGLNAYYITHMLKNAARAGLLVIVAAGALYLFTDVRVTVDGSGVWPRIESSAPDYDRLEADRARQRERLVPPADGPGVAASPPAAVSVERAPSESHPAASEPPDPRTPPIRPPEWPDFRGPRRDGRYDGPPIRRDWPREGLPQLWKQPVGLGYASFVVADGRAFTIEQRRDQEVVAAYDIETGRELWTNGWTGEFVESMGGDGPRATPTYHQGRIFALGALGELRCLDARSGALIWRRNILTDADSGNLPWGMSGSPLIVDDAVIVLPGGRPGKSVAAYAWRTGAPLWQALDDSQAYVSPMLVTLGGVRQLLVVAASRALGITVENGQLLWEYPWATDMGINVAQPLLVGQDRVFLSAGYGKGAAVFEVSREANRFTTRTVWQNIRMKNKFTSSVLHQGYIYGLDEAILACVDAATGELKWKGGRYGYGQILLAGDHIVVLTEDGEVALVKATPEGHQELATFSAIEGKTWNHPVIANGRLLVRNLREMAAFDIRPR
jgi:outer membrane protein assembly factor BamB